MSEVFGFHSIDENLFSADDWSFTETYYDSQNVLNVLGWIPVLSSVTGCIRIGATGVMWVGDDESHRSDHKKYFLVSGLRGGVEFCGLGWLFIIPDLVMTGRPHKPYSRFQGFRKNKSKDGKRSKSVFC